MRFGMTAELGLAECVPNRPSLVGPPPLITLAAGRRGFRGG
jgi:hypothetical protein